ncbi:tetratricopeptide repeat protein [Qipengyuania sp. NPDC077563]|uniref:tetratricopeptide repeat protein n=1 Tax=Qipengyuania sp. NPDC077563 TaxID=3364497 RepID=UPI00384B3801
MFKKALLIGAAVVATPAHAEDWWVAESDHFKVVSEGGREMASDVAVSLERLDQSLRLFRGLPIDEGEVAESEKVTIYQTGTIDDVGDLANSDGVAGFFVPRAGNSVAFVPAEEERRSRGRRGTRQSTGEELSPGQVLFHEYTHYFSRQHAPAAYPFWYSEGFAELFATIRFNEGGFNLGEPPRYRNFVLSELSFDVEDILDLDTEEGRVSGMDVARQYAYGWMFTSYLSFEPSRQGQLANYLRLVTAGTPNLDAARQAFGDLDVLQRELEKYHRGRARAIAVDFPPGSAPDIELTQLDEAEAAAMPIHIRSTAGVTKRGAPNVAARARDLLSRYPKSPEVIDAAMEAEFDAEEYTAASELANRLMASDSNTVRPYLYLAKIALEDAKSDPAKIAEARRQLIAANQINPERPDILKRYFDTFVYAGEQIPEDARVGLEQAFRIAPFDIGIRRSLAYLLLLEKRDSEALIILGPVVNLPHASGEEIDELREMVRQAEAGDSAALMEELRPKIDDDENEEEDLRVDS